MKTNELRIGNYVNSYSLNEVGKYAKNKSDRSLSVISCLSSAIIRYDCAVRYNHASIEPIPLTEDWLIKFGWVFNYEADCYEFITHSDSRLFLNYKEVNNSFDMFNYVLKAIICKDLKYVHQLQNLYFALTNKELTIK